MKKISTFSLCFRFTLSFICLTVLAGSFAEAKLSDEIDLKTFRTEALKQVQKLFGSTSFQENGIWVQESLSGWEATKLGLDDSTIEFKF